MLNISVAAVLAAGAAFPSASAAPLSGAAAIGQSTGTSAVPVWGSGFWWGFGPGVVVGGALAAPYYYRPYPYYYYPPGPYGYYPAPGYAPAGPGGGTAYCASRYRSYDPATGTFMGHDGFRHPCP
jgi:hypothetical protein